MKQIRWYDKNIELKAVFEIIQKLEPNIQKNIAQDILQILLTNFDLNLDNQINTINQNYAYKRSRWYDKNMDLFTSFEIIKDFSPKLQTILAKKIIMSILLTYLTKSKTLESELCRLETKIYS
jgi:hypothetical protein